MSNIAKKIGEEFATEVEPRGHQIGTTCRHQTGLTVLTVVLALLIICGAVGCALYWIYEHLFSTVM